MTLNFAGFLGLFFSPVSAAFLLKLYQGVQTQASWTQFLNKNSQLISQTDSDFFFLNWKFEAGLCMLDLKSRFPISWTLCPNDIPSVPSVSPWRSSWGEACLLAHLRHPPGHMGHHSYFTATHEALLSTKLCVARNKTKRQTKKIKFALWEEVAS